MINIENDLSDIKVGDVLHVYYLCRNGKNKNRIIEKKAIVTYIFPYDISTMDIYALHDNETIDDFIGDANGKDIYYKPTMKKIFGNITINKYDGVSHHSKNYHIVFKVPNRIEAEKYIMDCLKNSIKKRCESSLNYIESTEEAIKTFDKSINIDCDLSIALLIKKHFGTRLYDMIENQLRQFPEDTNNTELMKIKDFLEGK